MKKGIFLVLVLSILFVGCTKKEAEKTVDDIIIEENQPQEQQINQNNNKKEDMGLQIEILQEGTGDQKVEPNDVVTVHYTGTLEDGTKFDSSVDRGTPFPFTIGVGQVIKGWDEGVLGMKIGEKRKLTIPSDMAYGDRGAGELIPPGATLIFEVELIAIK